MERNVGTKTRKKYIFTALKFAIFPNMMVVLCSTGRDCSSRIGQDIWYIRLQKVDSEKSQKSTSQHIRLVRAIYKEKKKQTKTTERVKAEDKPRVEIRVTKPLKFCKLNIWYRIPYTVVFQQFIPYPKHLVGHPVVFQQFIPYPKHLVGHPVVYSLS